MRGGCLEQLTGPCHGLLDRKALADLDRVVARLESGEVGLEEAVALFEEGQRHLRACRERLGVAQRRIEELTSEDLPDAGDEASAPGEAPF